MRVVLCMAVEECLVVLRDLTVKAKPVMRRVLDTVFPPRCLICNAMVTQNGTLCADCWKAVPFITEPVCSRCGYPLPSRTEEGALCGACIQDAPLFAQARAVFQYEHLGRELVHRLKYGDRTHITHSCGQWLLRAGKPFVMRCDLIVPVPVHRWRLLLRRYNQSALLARALSGLSGIAWHPDVLYRRKYTRPQAGLSRAQRLVNVRGNFRFRSRRKELIRDKRILLLDDVMTTGATLHACTEQLLKAGAREVCVLTLARTL